MLATVVEDNIESAVDKPTESQPLKAAVQPTEETEAVEIATTVEEEPKEPAAEKPVEPAEATMADGKPDAVEEAAEETVDSPAGAEESAVDLAEELQGLDAVPGLVDAGRKHFTLQNWEGAVQVFGKAAEILSSYYGPFALECADSMVWYGRSLIRNAVAQAGLVDTKNADKKQGGAVDTEAGPSSHFAFLDEGEEDEEEGDEEAPAAGTADGEQEIETDETDDDFTLAWEALSVAAKIYEDQESEECKRKLADVYMLMGDCCLEDDNSTQAIDTFKKALDLKESYLEETNRELAEVHHLLGLAYEHDNLIDDAVAQVEKAKGVLQKRVELLKQTTGEASNSKGKGKATETETSASEEIVELDSLIVEIDAKLDDLQNLVAQQAEGDAEAKKESLAAQVEAGVPVNDLSNLIVKKKRRAEDATEAGAAEGDAKRPKTDGPSA